MIRRKCEFCNVDIHRASYVKHLRIKKLTEKLTLFYARLINQNNFRYQTVFSARIHKQYEDNQVIEETELLKTLNINHNLTESDLDKFDVKSSLKHQIQQLEMKDSGWRFDKNSSMTVDFYKTGEINGQSYVKIPLRSSAVLNIESKGNYCFLWSILAYI